MGETGPSDALPSGGFLVLSDLGEVGCVLSGSAHSGDALPARPTTTQPTLEQCKEMKLPPLYNFVRIAAQIVTALGCITGLVTLYPALSMFRFSFMMGMSVAVMGIFYIVGSLTGLGLIYGFLAIFSKLSEKRIEFNPKIG